MRIAISGHGECGKDTVSQMLAELFGLKYDRSTSEFSASLVYKHYLRDSYPDFQSAWDDRRNHRELWGKAIAELNGSSKCEIYKMMIEDNEILNGIRRREELMAAKEAGLIDMIIWVNRDGTPVDSTLDYGPEDCDLVVDNSGDLTDLWFSLCDLLMDL